MDVKAEHFERQVQSLEGEKDALEKKYEDALEKVRLRSTLLPLSLEPQLTPFLTPSVHDCESQYKASKKELDEVVQQLESL